MTTLLLAWLAGRADAAEPQYRQVKLVDGRVLLAEILATEPQGLRIRVPAGEMIVSFELLLDMVPIGQSQYDQQTPWVVYYDVPPAIAEDTATMLAAMPGLEPQPVDTPGNGIVSGMAFKAAACQRDVDCMADAVRDTPWKWVLAGTDAATGGIVLHSKLNTSSDRSSETFVDGTSDDALWTALHAALGLSVPPGGPPRGSGGPPTDEPTRAPVDSKRVLALSFVPLPGLPSLIQHDPAGFGLAMGVVVPSTALWVGAVGQTGQSTPEFGAIAFGGYYAVTVLVNQVTGLRSLEKAKVRPVVSAAPSPGGGAMVIVGGVR